MTNLANMLLFILSQVAASVHVEQAAGPTPVLDTKWVFGIAALKARSPGDSAFQDRVEVVVNVGDQLGVPPSVGNNRLTRWLE